MSEIGTWSPEPAALPDVALVKRLGAGGCAHPDDPRAVLTDAEVSALAPLMRLGQDAWRGCFDGVEDELLVGFVRFMTVAEMALPGWRGDDRSPVIAAARELKARGAWPAELSAWIKAHSDNRFLPYGSLLDRLS